MELTFSFHIKKEPIVFLAVSTYLKETNIALIIWLFWDNKKWLLCMQFSPVIIMNKGDAPRCTRITISINCFDFSNKKKKKKTASYTQHKGRAENLLHVVGNFKREQIHFPYLQIYFLFFLNIFSSMTTQEMVLWWSYFYGCGGCHTITWVPIVVRFSLHSLRKCYKHDILTIFS